MSEIKDGKPTGKLKDNLMEVELYVQDGNNRTSVGSRWIEITEAQRRLIEGKSVTMSMASVGADVIKNASNFEVKVGQHGNPMFLTKVDHAICQSVESAAQVKVPDSHGRVHVFGQDVAKQVETQLSDVSLREVSITDTGVAASFFDKGVNGSAAPEAQGPKREHSGFNVNYYSVEVKHPKRPERAPYTFEVEDLIQALNMTFHEGTVLKSLVRSCVEREFGIGKVGGDYIRDAEKMVHSSQETLRIRKLQKDKAK